MYNTLALLALLPLAGPEAGEHLAGVAPATALPYVQVGVADRTPALPAEPVRTTVAYPPASDGALPMNPPARPEPVYLPQTPVVASSTPLTAPSTPTTFAPTAGANTVETRGILEVPKWNNVVLSAPNSANQSILMTLKTEKRDHDGNIVHDASGEPVMIPLREGVQVFKDQVLGSFDNRELVNQLRVTEAELKVAEAAMNKRIEVEFAATSVMTAVAQLNILKATNQMHEGAITRLEIIKSELEVEQAKANLALQKYTLNIERAEETNVRKEQVEAMKVRILLRKIIAPISGMIVRIDKAEGEWLREGDPVLEIMQLDTLRAKCKVDARRFTPDMVDGKTVSVYMPMVDGRTEEFPGKVVFADPKVSAGDEFEVFIEVQNRPVGRSWLLQPGRTVTAVIKL